MTMTQKGYIVKVELPSRSSEVLAKCPPVARRIVEVEHLATDEYHATLLVLVEEG